MTVLADWMTGFEVKLDRRGSWLTTWDTVAAGDVLAVVADVLCDVDGVLGVVADVLVVVDDVIGDVDGVFGVVADVLVVVADAVVGSVKVVCGAVVVFGASVTGGGTAFDGGELKVVLIHSPAIARTTTTAPTIATLFTGLFVVELLVGSIERRLSD